MKSNYVLDEIKVTILFSHAFIVTVRQSAVDKGLSVQPGLGHWQTLCRLKLGCRMQHLIRVCTVLKLQKVLRV